MRKLFKITTLSALAASWSIPLLAVAQTGINLTQATAYKTGIVGFINGILVPVLMAISFIVFFWGVYKYFILGAADEKSRTDGKQFTLWGIIGFVVILSLWAFVNIIQGTLGLTGGQAPAYPTIGGSYVPSGYQAGTVAGNNVFASNGSFLGTVNSSGQIVNSAGQVIGNIINGQAVSTAGVPIAGSTVGSGSTPNTTGLSNGEGCYQPSDCASGVCQYDTNRNASFCGFSSDTGGAVCDNATIVDCEQAGLTCDASTGTLQCV